MHRAKRVSIFLSKIFGAEFLMRFTSNTLPAPPFYHKMWRGKKCGFYEAVYGTKFGKILSIYFQDIERKQKSDINQGP